MRYNKFFNANFRSFVIFSAVCFFFQLSFADDSMCTKCGNSTVCNCQTYCETSADMSQSQVREGCGNGYYPNGKYLEYPEFEPKWTTAIDNSIGVKGGEYIEFKLEAGMTYRWTTYDELEDFTGGVDYYKSCTSDSECGSQMKCYGKLSTGAGYCMWPFNTELTLIDTTGLSDTCSNGKVLAFSRTGGYENQSAIEYKAPRDMKVALLVTNYKYNTSNNTFVSCQNSKIGGETLTTVLKWQRFIPEHCSVCGDENDYSYNKINNLANGANPNKAPSWTPVSAYNYIDMPNYADPSATEKWLKPGSYVDFSVEEGKIYRWATCKSVFYDTQLTLFKPDDNDTCGKFLAFDDDSETSYLPQNPYDQAGNDYCPAGTKQSVLEWHANFTGTVRLLVNEYNCSQCARDNNSAIHWTHCFSVSEDYVISKDGEGNPVTDEYGNPVIEKDDMGFPVVAGSSTASTERVTLTYLYSFPLDWQRYDCEDCRDTAVKYVADQCGYAKYNGSCVSNVCNSFGSYTPFCTEENDTEVCGDTVTLESGRYMTFALRRGSKYIFETPGRPEVVITVKSGKDCKTGRTLAQGVGQVAYFAETSAECFDSQDDPNKYSDVVTVLVSEPECENADGNIKTINLKYSFYPDPLIKFDNADNAADSKKRFNKITVGDDSYYEDSATGIRFIESEQFAGTWEKAIDICQNLVLGSGSGAISCPDPVCPEVPQCPREATIGGHTTTVLVPCYTLTSSGYNTCEASNDQCAAPSCRNGYAPYVDSSSSDGDRCDVHPELCGLCISAATGKNCDVKQNGACSSGNTCVTKEGNSLCASANAGAGVGVKRHCSDPSYTSIDDNYCIDETEEAGDIYYDVTVTNAHADSGMHLVETQGNNGTSCPSGMHLKNGVCEYDNCGSYTLKDNANCNGSGYILDKTKCYKKISTLGGIEGGEIPCCTGKIDVWDRNVIAGRVSYAINKICGDIGYVSGDPAAEPVIPCADGWTYLNNQCHRCKTGDDGCGWDGFDTVCCDGSNCTPYATNSGNVSCRPKCDLYYSEALNSSDVILQHCVTCEDGSDPIQIDGNWKCLSCPEGGTLTMEGSEYKCKKSCTGGYIQDGKCYTKIPKAYSCKDGWIEKDGYCRKIDTQKEYPDCSGVASSTMTSTPDHTCKNEAGDFRPNTIDCWCKTEKCGIGTVDKVCPASVCMVNGVATADQPDMIFNPCKNKDKYPVTQGIGEDGNILCSFTDLSSNETCGQPSKGWALPDVNQLYSLVDFDLYDPVTVFPFKNATYNRDELNTACSSGSDCETGYTCDAASSRCTKTCSADTDCSADGTEYICVNGKCARNNWFWSSTTVLSKNENEGQFVWAVNMEDGRSYRVLKGCMDDESNPDKCAAYAALNLHATKYQVMCIKGSTFASLFHPELPQTQQVFSGWACDKERADNVLNIYFEIVDSEGVNVSTFETSSLFVNIPGTTVKGVKYGVTDGVAVVDSDDYYKIRNNCGSGNTGKPYLFELDLNNPGTKEAVADAIKSIQGHGKAPYYVTAYAVDTTIDTASIIQPSKERFVLENECGDTYKTYDGNYTEDCEKSDFTKVCSYTSPWSEDPAHHCQICDQESCLWTNFRVPGCGDTILQSRFCVKEGTEEHCGNATGESCKVSQGTAVYSSAHPNCEYYDFEGNALGTFTEQCDCGNAASAAYLLTENGDGTYSCGIALAEAKCPDSQYYNGEGNPNCVICDRCVVDTTKRKPFCGDGNTHYSEACDDGNLAENDDCLNDCTEARCGDGKVRSNPDNEADKEACDAGGANGTYAGGCSSDCKTVYTCGDGMIQNANCTSKCSACNSLPDSDPKKADCINTWCNNCVIVADASEECDEGNDNGQPITYERFLNSLDDEWKSKCSAELNGIDYPITELQTNFSSCLAKYKAFAEDHACSSTCTKSNVPTCGDGKIQRASCGGLSNCEEVPGANEVCDDGYDTTQSKYNGRGYQGGCALDCQFKYGCGTTEMGGRDSDGTIDRPTCLPDMVAVSCDASTPASTIGLEYPGEMINGSKEHISDKNVLLFVKMATGSDEDCDAGTLNGQYGICNSTCSGKPFCGDKNVSTGNEICDEGLGDGGNKTIEEAWSANYGGTCIGKFYDNEGNNICTDTPDKWNAYGVGDKCCQFGRYCGDGIVDNSLDGVGSTNDEGVVTDPNEWRNDAKWIVGEGSLVDVYTEDLDLAIGMTLKNADEYQDVELDIEIPIVEGLRYFVEYDVKVQKVNDETVTMHAGAKMYDSTGSAIPTCTGTGCLDTNPLFFVENSETPLAGNVWINKKNSTPVVKADGASSSANNWKADTSYVKLYFQFKGKKYTSFIIRGLKVYTLESGKGAASGQGADEMCDNGEGNLDIEAAKADTSYMSACTKYVNETDRKQDGCRWTNYCGDRRKHSVEACDNGENKTNVYNGCEPGCTEVGPHCGDGMLDIKPSDECPFKKIDEEACEALGLGDVCEEYTEDETKCNRVSEKYSGNTYDAEGNFTGTTVNFVSESCDTGSTNSNQFLGTKNGATVTITEANLDINNYGTCRTDCTFSRCGDGILDYVVRADENGVPKTKEVLDSNGNTVTVYDYVEECDCGFVEAALLPGYESSDEYALNQKTSEGVYICKDATGKYFPNSNNGEKTDGVSCRSNCTISRCGDGVRDYNEACDDGNNDDHDDCTNNCQIKSSCGDGIFSFKRSYLCEELLDLPLSSSDSGVPTMTTMRDRGVVDCCDANDSACIATGTPLCSKLVTDLTTAEGYPYGHLVSGKLALHYWFERKVMHCCFNKKYETGNDADDDKNCINSDHVFGDIVTLKDFVDFTCQYQAETIVDPWEKCGNVSYSERCEFCDSKNAKCGCDKAFAVGSSAYDKCMENCEKDPCGCLAYCEYKDPDAIADCAGDDSCIKENLKGCISACEDRNKYCDTKNTPCWNRNGACGDGVVGYREPDPANPEGPGIVVGNVNEKCDNLESGSSQFADFDGNSKPTTAQDLDVRGGSYCTGACRGSCTSRSIMCDTTPENNCKKSDGTCEGVCDSSSPSCGVQVTTNCWEIGCSVADHGSGSLSRCGDGRMDAFAGEACDEGEEINGYYGHCNQACDDMLARCGDGATQTGTDERGQTYNEKCDDGDNNGKYKNDDHGYCNTDCQARGDGGYCGDQIIQNSSSTDCSCIGEDCKNADGLVCKSGVAGAAEVCDPKDTRTKNLTDIGIEIDDICPNCERNGSCGDGFRNPRFEGCDCSTGNGSGTCTVAYGSAETYGLGEGESGVKYNCFAGCKADPIGNLETVLPVELSGWACDPDHPMEHPAFVELVFYDRNSNVIKTTDKMVTNEDVSNDVVKACGGGAKHGWFYNPNTEGTGVTDFESQNPVKVEVYAYSIDKGNDSSSPETTKVKIGEATLTLGQQCGDGLVTKCEDIPIIPKTGSGTIKDGWVCHDEGNSCGSNTSCIEVRGTCSAYGLADNVACVDEKCDEGAANGPTGKCSNGKDLNGQTHTVMACDYNYCGDGIAQKDGNGKAFSTSVGYNESGYTSPSNPKAFNEECESGETTACNLIFTTPCGATETGECVPSGATVKQTSSCAKDSSNNSTCKWKKTSECEIEHDCLPLDSAVAGKGWGWNAAGNSISYANGDTVAKYTRTWDGSAWTPAAPTALKHNNTTGSTSAETSCWFKCYNEGDNSGKAKLVWNESTKKCVKQNGTLQCNKCSDPNGENAITHAACNTNNWKPVTQTINVSSAGIVSISPTSLPAPAEADHLPSGNNGDCSYVCKEGTEYAKVYGTASTYQCQYSKPKTLCTGIGTGEVWAKVTKSGSSSYTVEKVSELYVEQTLNPASGAYSPAATKYKFANDANIKDGSVVDDNKCYFMCAKGYVWNGTACQFVDNLKCGDGILTTNQCNQSSIYNGMNTTPSYNVTIAGKTYGCYYDPNPESQEVCDDGALNGMYNNGTVTLNNGNPTSACNTTCTGRIMEGSKFFCGDGQVQKKSGNTNSDCGSGVYQSSNCDLVTGNSAGQNPGLGWIGAADDTYFPANGEKCDPEDSSTKNNREKLCNMALGKTSTPEGGYYAQSGSTMPSCSSCSSITNATKTTGCNYCGDDYLGGSENCESRGVDGVDGIRYGNANSDVFNYKDTTALDTSSATYTTFTIKVSGIYEITAKGAAGGNGGGGGAASGADLIFCTGSSGGSGGTRAYGGTVTAQYYFAKGTKLKLYAGQKGGNGGAGNKNSSTGGTAGSKGLSYSSTYDSGKSGDAGTTGNGQAGSKGGSGGGGGGGGGASVVTKEDGTLLIVAHGGGGGGGGEGGGPCNSGGSGYNAGSDSGKLPCLGASDSSGHSNNDNGGRGREGGNGGRYSNDVCSFYASGNIGTATKTDNNNDAVGSISITLKKYAPCKTNCTFATNTSDFIDVKNKKSACTGLIDNAQWNTVSSITQTPSGSGWTPDTAASHNTTASSTSCRYKCVNNYNYETVGGVTKCYHEKNVSCTGLESNAVWTTTNTTSKTIKQTFSGADGSGSWSPTTTGAYNTNTDANLCYYKCDSTHTRYNGACVNSRSGQTCTGLPAHAHWTSNNSTSKTITQTWDPTLYSDCISNPNRCWKSTTVGSHNSSNAANECYFQCNTNYTWNSSTKKCVANTQVVDCTNLPTHNAWWWATGSETAPKITQTWDENGAGCTAAKIEAGECWYPTNVGSNTTAGATNQCYFHCKHANYHYNGTTNRCVAEVQTYNCHSKPDDSLTVWNTVSSYQQEWTDSGWYPPNSTPAFSETASTTSCKFKCKPNHTWNSSTQKCDANKRTKSCTTSESNITWHNTTIEQTWNEAQQKWLPTLTGEYNTEADSRYCRFKCDGTHTRWNNACVNERDYSCNNSTLPDNTVWTTTNSTSKTIHQEWKKINGEWQWDPTLTGEHNTSTDENKCYYKCEGETLSVPHFNWSNGACVAGTQIKNCGTLPANAQWWASSTAITQTWDASQQKWLPETTPSYSSSSNTSGCYFHCYSSGREYGWTGTACKYCGDGEISNGETCDGSSFSISYTVCMKNKNRNGSKSCGTCDSDRKYQWTECYASCTNSCGTISWTGCTAQNSCTEPSYNTCP